MSPLDPVRSGLSGLRARMASRTGASAPLSWCGGLGPLAELSGERLRPPSRILSRQKK